MAAASSPKKDTSSVQNSGTHRRDPGVAYIPLPQNTLVLSTSEAIENHQLCGEGSGGPARTTDSSERGFGEMAGVKRSHSERTSVSGKTLWMGPICHPAQL